MTQGRHPYNKPGIFSTKGDILKISSLLLQIILFSLGLPFELIDDKNMKYQNPEKNMLISICNPMWDVKQVLDS